jgi:hypothetical protein
MSTLATFMLLIFAGGLGGFLGSVLGGLVGPRALFVGGVVGGLVTSATAALLAARLRWIAADEAKPTAVGAALGFLAAAAVASLTLSSPVGPLLSSPLLVGMGGLAGRRLRPRVIT